MAFSITNRASGQQRNSPDIDDSGLRASLAESSRLDFHGPVA
ncbi:MAG: hypothetical protein QGH60_11735 [Phycisphaerae bacterium]|nr:hypothetical protein [Phycisphaerae bacterium]